MKFFTFLHTAERPKRSFSCFCTLQKGQKGVFHASAHYRKAKKSFSRFCTLQKDQNEVFHASAHCRKAKKKFFTLLHTAERPKRSFSCFCTLQKDQKEIFRAWRKSFPERFDISAHGESHFPRGLAFPRTAKVISRVVWHFRARRKSFPERFGACANRLFIRMKR